MGEIAGDERECERAVKDGPSLAESLRYDELIAMTVPDPVRDTAEHVLEFDRLREMLAVYAASPLGRSRIATLAPSGGRDWIERQQQLTEELRGYLRCGGKFRFLRVARS